VITTRGLTKRFGRVVAVDDLALDVREGDRFGFLGPNGSGKTTTVRMLLGLVYATSGEIDVLGQPVPRRAAEVLPQVGALVEGPAAYGHLSGRANLSLMDAAGPQAWFLHCLPAHRGEEVTSEVADGPRSLIWPQAENRMHAARGLLAWILEQP